MNPKIEQEVPISIYDLKNELKKIAKRDTQLSVRAAKTEEFINQFSDLKQNNSEKLEEEINKLEIPRMKDFIIKKIIDCLPQSIEELKVVLQGYTITMSKENMEKIVALVRKYVPES
jgi:DNA-directed RNA polymerase subunit F